MTRPFGLGAVLSVSTGKGCATLTEIGLLCEHLLDTTLLHPLALKYALDPARAVLLAQYPWLDAIVKPDYAASQPEVKRWLALLVEAGLPETLNIRSKEDL